jgi:hypothetical protein
MAVEKIIAWNRVSSCKAAGKKRRFGPTHNDELTIVVVSVSVQLDSLMSPSHAVFTHSGTLSSVDFYQRPQRKARKAQQLLAAGFSTKR